MLPVKWQATATCADIARAALGFDQEICVYIHICIYTYVLYSHREVVWWQVLAPYDAEDARGLLKAAIRDPDPVVFLENEILYGEAFPVDDKILDKDFTVPIGKVKVLCFIPLCAIVSTYRDLGACIDLHSNICVDKQDGKVSLIQMAAYSYDGSPRIPSVSLQECCATGYFEHFADHFGAYNKHYSVLSCCVPTTVEVHKCRSRKRAQMSPW